MGHCEDEDDKEPGLLRVQWKLINTTLFPDTVQKRTDHFRGLLINKGEGGGGGGGDSSVVCAQRAP